MNIQQAIPMTTQGVERLKEELHQLKTFQRPKVIQAIADARANGDLKENADYHAAREQQAFIEGRILDLENKLARSQVIDVSKIHNEGKIIFGATVTLSIIAGIDKINNDISNLAKQSVDSLSKSNNSAKQSIDSSVNKNTNLVKYQIVGDEEADLKQYKISISSPIARGLIGKYEGDVVHIQAPSGVVSYEIEKVEYI